MNERVNAATAGAEVACLHLRLKIAYEKAEEKERWGLTDSEIDAAIAERRRQMEQASA